MKNLLTIHKDLIQRSPEWLEYKKGKLSASVIAPIMAGKSLGKGARTLALALLGERLLELPEEPGYVSFDMQRGIDLEPEAFALYNKFAKVPAVEVGGVQLKEYWYSPDGVVFNGGQSIVGLIEIKCLAKTKHYEALTGSGALVDHKAQVQFGMLVSGAQWCDMVYFNPDFKEGYELKITREDRDEVYLADMTNRLDQFDELMKGLAI